jgi:hypothetical protein
MVLTEVGWMVAKGRSVGEKGRLLAVLNRVVADPVTCVIYAKDHGLLDTIDRWKHTGLTLEFHLRWTWSSPRWTTLGHFGT